LRLLQLDLRAHPPMAPVKKIWLSAEAVRPRVAQGGLFMPASPEPEKMELVLARIRGVVGGKDPAESPGEDVRTGSPQLLDTHRPGAFHVQRFSPPQEETEQSAAIEARQSALSALRIFRPPLRAKVQVREGAPCAITILDPPDGNKVQSLAVQALAGPWRSSGGWWAEAPWARDEWDVALMPGEDTIFYRIFHDLLAEEWRVEGIYD